MILFSFASDVGLIRLPQPVQCSEYIHTILLATATTVPDGTDALTIGYGRLGESDNEDPKIVQYAKLKTVPLLFCVVDNRLSLFEHRAICAENEAIGLNKEDAGNPLVLDNILIGIASTTTNFVKGATHGYASVNAYGQWIEGEMGKYA